MRELKATDKITQKMTRDGAVSENLATGEVEHISSREPETELSASSEESAGAAADLALRAAEHHEKKSARKAEKADTQAVRDGSAARQRPSSRLQFTEEEHADPALGKYIDRSDRAADRLDAAKAAIPTKKVLRTERVFDETAGKGKTQLHFEEVEKRPNGRLRHNPLSRPVHEIAHAAHAKVHEVEQENVGVEAGHKGEVLTERGLAYGKGKVRAAVHHHRTKPWRDAAKAEQASFKANADYLYQKALHDDPALAASNPVSRFLQKQRIKRNYAKELRQAEKTAKNTAATAKSAAQKAKDAFKETFLYIKHHMIAGHEFKKDLEARMLPLVLDIGEIAGRKIHFVTHFVSGLFLSRPRCFDCCPIRAKVNFLYWSLCHIHSPSYILLFTFLSEYVYIVPLISQNNS